MATFRRPSRRQFVKTTAAGAAALSMPGVTSAALGVQDGAKPMQLGFIGIGKMGQGHLGGFLGYKGVLVTAVCDVYEPRLSAARETVDNRYADLERRGAGACKAYQHYRDLLA